MPPLPPIKASLVVGSYDSMPRPPERHRFGYSSHRSPRSTVRFGPARQRSRMYSAYWFSKLFILMNWLLFPETSGVPSRNDATEFQSFSNDGVSPRNPTAASSAWGFR